MKPPCILIVDDETPTRELCSDILIEEGYATEQAASAKEALLALQQKVYQVVLSDIQMPEMDGLTLLKEVRRQYPETEVILMTAHAGLPSAIEAVRGDAYDYLPKPLSREGLVSAIRHCLEKVELRLKLKESQAKLIEQEKLAAVGAVSAWLSHRMRNSLSVILMCAHYLQQKTAPKASDDLKEVIDAILTKVRTLEHITSDLITYSRRYELQKRPENLNTILEDTVQALQGQVQKLKLNLVKNLDPKLPDITVDPHVIHEAFENVLMNALQAVGNSEGQSLILKSEVLKKFVPRRPADPLGVMTVSNEKKSVSAVAVSISNTGSVIPPENRGKIFTPFFTTKDDGSGLGLAIVKKIMEDHGGEIFAESSDDSGIKITTIKMVFPLS